jgi:hypothetical protein
MRAYSGTLPMPGSEPKIKPQLDITEPDGDVVVEYDRHRGVLYVHMEGVTVLRVCRIEGNVILQRDGNTQPLVMPRRRTT